MGNKLMWQKRYAIKTKNKITYLLPGV